MCAKIEAMAKHDPTCMPMEAWVAQMRKKMIEPQCVA
jgi:hypothetical protein